VTVIGRVLLVLLVPIAWGVVSAWAFDRLRLWRACQAEGTENEDEDAGKGEEPG